MRKPPEELLAELLALLLAGIAVLFCFWSAAKDMGALFGG